MNIKRAGIGLILALMVIGIFISLSKGMNKNISDDFSLINLEPQQNMDDYPLPFMTLIDKDGKTFTTKELEGNVLFINFWATWCGPCKQEMPTIQELKDYVGEGADIKFLMIDVDKKMEQSIRYMDSNGFDFEVLMLEGNIPTEIFNGALPTTVIVNKKGNVEGVVEGYSDYSTPQVKAAIDALLAE